ncbi:hypothetical protein ABK040_007798 [Willaertia magna]
MLGTGGAGKSTIFKNIKLLYHNGFDTDELRGYKEVILSNIVQMVQYVLKAMNTLFPNAQLENPENEEFANSIKRLDCEDFIHILRVVDESFVQKLQSLWREEKIIQQVYHFKHKYQLPVEQLPELIDQMDKIFIMPNTKNVISSYVKTTVSLSEYNQVCYEDDRSNRMQESLLLFEEIVNAHCFENIPIFLVFNKRDVFLQKLQYFDISDAFNNLPNYLKVDSNNPIYNFKYFTKINNLLNDEKKERNFKEEEENLDEMLSPVITLNEDKEDIFNINNNTTIINSNNIHHATSTSAPPIMSDYHHFNNNNNNNCSIVSTTTITTIDKKESNWNILSNDILIYICFYLEEKDLCSLSLVNYDLYLASTSDVVWRNVCYHYIKDINEEQVNLFYKERYSIFENNHHSNNSNLLLTIDNCRYSRVSDISVKDEQTILSINQNNYSSTSTTTTENISDDDSFTSINNKEDLHEKVIKKGKWRFFYEAGNHIYRESLNYIKEQYIKLARDDDRREQLRRDVRVTSAVESSEIKEMLEHVFDSILNLQKERDLQLLGECEKKKKSFKRVWRRSNKL